jgi:type I restriction enzyme, S subunit
MQATANTYLKYIDLILLENWSVQGLLDAQFNYSNQYKQARIGDFLIKCRNIVNIENNKEYNRVKVKINNNGVVLRDIEKGVNIGTKKQYRANSGQFIISKIDARNGAFGIIPNELDNAIVTNDFPLFDVNTKKINPQFLLLITTTNVFIKFAQSCSSGTTNRQRMDIDMFLNQKIPLPELEQQNKIVKDYNNKLNEAKRLIKKAAVIANEIETILFDGLGLTKTKEENKRKVGLKLTDFKNIQEWGLDKIFSKSNIESSLYKLTSIEENTELAIDIFRGKSPIYKDDSGAYILNQKCNRWNDLDLSFVKSVDKKWLESVSKNNLTKEGDILINSTGEGTIGRASYIKKEFEGLLYDSHLLLLRFNRKKVNPELFVELFNSDYGQNQVNDIKSAQATKQTELGVSNLTKIKFPLLKDLEVQKGIILKIKKLRIEAIKNLETASTLEKEAQTDFENIIFNN